MSKEILNKRVAADWNNSGKTM